MAERSRKKREHPSEQTRVMTAGTTVRIEQPKSSRNQPEKPSVSVIVSEVNPVGGFFNFLREHSVVSLAVGFAIATQAQALIKQLITSFIDPLYGLLFNGDKLSQKMLTAHFHGRTQQFGWGIFVYTLIDFLFVLLFIYLIIKLFNLDKLDKPKK
jgi:large-conductance mechanosensitive channel